MRCARHLRLSWLLQYEMVAAKVFKSERIAQFSRLTITDKEAGAVHYDTDKDCMYLGARATICSLL